MLFALPIAFLLTCLTTLFPTNVIAYITNDGVDKLINIFPGGKKSENLSYYLPEVRYWGSSSEAGLTRVEEQTGGRKISFLYPGTKAILDGIRINGGTEHAVRRITRQFLVETENEGKRDSLFLDVGANGGYYGLWALAAGIETHFFDLQPSCTQRIAHAIAQAGNQSRARVYLLGISNDTTFFPTSYETDCEGTFPRIPELQSNVKKKLPGEARLVGMAPLAKLYEHWASPIGMIKVDTEGNEIFVISGSMPLFKEKKIGRMICEYTPFFWQQLGYKRETAVQQLCQLQEYGYEISWPWKNIVFENCSKIIRFFQEDWVQRDLLVKIL